MKCPSCLTPLASGDRVCPVCQSSKDGTERFASWDQKKQADVEADVVCAMVCWVFGAMMGQASGSISAMISGLLFGFGCLGVSQIRWFHPGVRMAICIIIVGLCFVVTLALANDI